jgi:PIN domain nuclease of toxin-antitoxin system
MSKVILDTSALLALIKNEPGASTIEDLLGQIVISSLSLAEAATSLLQSEMTLQECEECLLPLVSQLIPLDASHALLTANLMKQLKGKELPLEARACLALGIKMNLPIYTANQIWPDLGLTDIDIKLIR